MSQRKTVLKRAPKRRTSRPGLLAPARRADDPTPGGQSSTKVHLGDWALDRGRDTGTQSPDPGASTTLRNDAVVGRKVYVGDVKRELSVKAGGVEGTSKDHIFLLKSRVKSSDVFESPSPVILTIAPLVLNICTRLSEKVK